MLEILQKYIMFSGGSRISCLGGPQPVRDTDFQHGCFSVKTYAKMIELGPDGEGGMHWWASSWSANDIPVHITRFVTVTMNASVTV